MLLALLATAALLLSTTSFLSLWWTLFRFTPVALRVPHDKGPLRVGVVLGSGGHTSEAMRLISRMPSTYWSDNRPFYIVSATDTHSAYVAQEQELRLFGRNALIHVIPRAREVGQSYASSVPSTLRALATSLTVMAHEHPDVLLTNGPGVCVPVVAAGILLAALMPWRYQRPAVVYFESFTCVRHVSLTGRLLAPFAADIFTVLWRQLLPTVTALRLRRRGESVGCGVYFIGCDASDAKSKGDGKMAHDDENCPVSTDNDSDRSEDPATIWPLPSHLTRVSARGTRQARTKFALVTVGSTRFDKLIRAVATESVCRTLCERFGITCLLLQYGTSQFSLSLGNPYTGGSAGSTTSADSSTHADPSAGDNATPLQQRLCAGVVVEAFPYRPNLSRWIAQADLVITHAGAGTIMECLHAHVPLVVVPNRDLMSDHQVELAEALAAQNALFFLSVEEVAPALGELDLSSLRRHRAIDADALRRVLSIPLSGKVARD